MTGYRDFLKARLRFLRRGRSLIDSIRMLRVWGYLHLRLGRLGRLTNRLPSRPPAAYDIRLDDGTDLRVRSCDMVLFEVFAYDAYDIGTERLGAVRSILDVGANVGFASVYLASRFAEARFVCVEPSPGSFAVLEENLRRNIAEAVAYNAAVVASPGSYRLNENPNPGLTEVTAGGAEGVSVEALTIGQVLDRAGLENVDLLKLDIEGGERELLEHPEGWANRVGAILAEIHEPMPVQDAAETLSGYGFERLPLPEDKVFERILLARRESSEVSTSAIRSATRSQE